MIKFKKILSFVLAFVLLASVVTNGLMSVFAVGSESTLTAVPAGVTPTEESLGTQVAYVANDTVTVYEYYENGALGMVCTGALGEQIELTKKFTYTVDGVDTVIYHFADSDFAGAMGAADDANYQFILASDVTFTAPEITPDPEPDETVIPDSATGVSVAGDLPDDVTLTVTTKTLAESGIDTTVYPISGASLFYDVTLLQNSVEYQPENGITVTFPEAAITNSGLAVGDYYKVYHIHDGATDVTGPFEYTGGAIDATFYSLSVVGLAESENYIDLVTQHGEATVTSLTENIALAINSDSVTLYDGFESNVFTAEVTGVAGIELEAFVKISFADGFVLYQYAYYGDDADFTTIANTYQFIAETDVTVAGEESKQTLSDVNGTGITVTGTLPTGSEIQATTTTNVPNAIISTSHFDSSVTITQFGYDISLYNNSSELIQPDGSVTVYIPNTWDTSLTSPIVDIYHILDDADAITAAKAGGTLLTTTDKEMVTTYAEEAAVARTALGLAETDADVVAYVLLSTRSNNVTLTENGGIQFETDSFSEYYIVSGDTAAGNITESSTIYITPGVSGTFTIQNTDVTITDGTVDTDVTVIKGAVSTDGRNQYTTFNVSANDSASLGDTSTYSLSWRGGGSTRKIIITVVVVDATEYIKQQYLGNTVNHLQIDIQSTAVALGYNNDESFSLNLGFSSNTSYTLTEVEDDSQVGFYYVLTYTYTDSNNVEIPVTITVRIDELATNLPEGVTFRDIGEKWFINQVISQESQVTFGNKSDSTKAQFPVGTSTNPIVYSITVETTKELTPNDSTTTEAIDITVSATINYWDDSNECPGKHSGSIGSQSGMDLGSFSTGYVLGETVVYVVYSDLTKIVEGYTFGATGNLASRSYVFKLERSTDSGATWTVIDTVSITVDSTGRATASVTADASKYCEGLDSVEEFEACLFRVSEISYNISGYTCEVILMSVDSSDNKTKLTEGKFNWSKKESSDGESVIFSVELECTNTYSEAGLTVNKVVENAPESAANDEFTVKVWPKELSTSGIESGTNMYTYFNTGTYKVSGTALTVTNSSSTTEYGYITLTFKAGDSKTVTGLPAGTYYVQEVAGANTNYDYDTTQYEANLSSGSAVVAITNTYKFCDLTITKTGWNSTDENQSFIFDVVGPDNFKITVTINGNGEVTIKDLPIGTYTVTENTDWSWRYTPAVKTQTITLVANRENEVAFDNNRSWIYWLSGDSYCKNWWGNNGNVIRKDDEE